MNPTFSEIWEWHIKSKGADFVNFVDASVLPAEAVEGYSCVVLFGKALSKEYINALRAGEPPKTKEVINTERKMDTLAVKIAALLESEGYNSIAKLQFGLLPHKTVALNAGLGFIGKNNLLVTEQFGSAVLFGKVLFVFRAGRHESPRQGAPHWLCWCISAHLNFLEGVIICML